MTGPRPSAPLRVTERIDYALKSVLFLSQRQDGFVAAETIADHYGMSFKMLSDVLRYLRTAGILVSRAGWHGGFKLGAPAEMIPVRSVIAAVAGSEDAPSIANTPTGDADPVGAFWQSLDQHVQRTLEHFTVGDLAAERPLD